MPREPSSVADYMPSESILVVDDDPDFYAAVRNVLEGEGYVVAGASNGRDALGLLLRGPLPDLVVVDLFMPVMDGWQLIQNMKALPELATIPVVVVSGAGDRALSSAPVSAGYVDKSLDAKRLVETVAVCLARSPRKSSGIVPIHDGQRIDLLDIRRAVAALLGDSAVPGGSAVDGAPSASILVVDDDPDFHALVREVLKGEGYAVTAASNGRDALDLLLRGPLPDLMVVDLFMPVMDGWQLIENMKARPELAAIPVVAVSGAGDRALSSAPVSAGYVDKSLNAARLVETIAVCLARRSRRTSGIIPTDG
jgi:CheY-like chemotaxis protein